MRPACRPALDPGDLCDPSGQGLRAGQGLPRRAARHTEHHLQPRSRELKLQDRSLHGSRGWTLTQCDDPVGAGTLAGDVEELRHVLVVQFQVEVAALVDDALLVVGAPGTGLAGAGLVWGGSVQPLPTLVVEGLGALAQRWVVVDAEDE